MDSTANQDSSQGSTARTTNLPPVQTAGFGGMANNLMEPVKVLASFLTGMALVIGLSCLFGAFVRYMQHRVNPLAHPISSVVVLFVLGVLLLLLPLIYKLTDSGVPGTLD
ncbi:MAG TPA: hypothetical protein VLI69_04795 [Gammaproteobacteria bacterium]|nr:hypothetical protein [Gammaproteobacteria bacterium]